MEWHQVQSQLRQLGLAINYRADRKRARRRAARKCATAAGAEKPDSTPGAASAVSGHTRKTGRLEAPARRETSLRLGCHAWLGRGLARRTFPAQWRRLRRNSRHARSALRWRA